MLALLMRATPCAAQIALVTGADSGIGRAIAVHYAKEGANVAIAYWKEHEDAKVVQKACEEAGVETLLLPGDVSEEATCKCATLSPHTDTCCAKLRPFSVRTAWCCSRGVDPPCCQEDIPGHWSVPAMCQSLAPWQEAGGRDSGQVGLHQPSGVEGS